MRSRTPSPARGRLAGGADRSPGTRENAAGAASGAGLG